MTRRWRPEDRHSDPIPFPRNRPQTISNTIKDEVTPRLEAAAALAAWALLGEIEPDLAFDGIVRLVAKAELHLRAVA